MADLTTLARHLLTAQRLFLAAVNRAVETLDLGPGRRPGGHGGRGA